MNGTTDLLNLLGILGAYFAILLILAVAVETILEPLTALLGPWLRKKISPEQAMKDVADWLPKDSDKEAKAQALLNLTEEYGVKKEDLTKRLTEVKNQFDTTSSEFGINFDEAEAKVAVGISEIRKKFQANEQVRIAILRFLSATAGVVIALYVQVDSFELLRGLIPDSFYAMFADPNTLHVAGMILTGLAASAGSSFWHDQLAKIRNLKETTQSVQENLKGITVNLSN
jgi:hypothetical protein